MTLDKLNNRIHFDVAGKAAHSYPSVSRVTVPLVL